MIMKKVALITINYNGDKNLKKCLESLYKVVLSDIFLTIYVVDNKSKQESLASIEKYINSLPSKKQLKTVLIKNTNNSGFTGGNNLGISKAIEEENEFIMLLNDDTVVANDLILILVTTISLHPDAGAVVPKVYFAPGYEYHKDRYKENEIGKVIWYAGGKMDWNNLIGHNIGVDEVDKGQFNREEEIELLTGCCVIFKREVLERVGLLDDNYFMYYEDADFSLRLKKFGYRLYFEPRGIVWHKNAGSSGGSGSSLQDYYISRNRLYFGMTYAPFRTKVALLRESFRMLLHGRSWQKIGIRDYFLHNLKKGSYG